ncbi:MAG: HAMP domain-containing sensor histidine kinase [Thermoleophilia bacterium]
MSFRSPTLRARLVVAFVAVVALAAVVTSILTSHGLHQTVDAYLRDRATDAGRSALSATEGSFRSGGSAWTARGLDLLAHDLAVSGYDYRLTAPDGQVLLDTTKAAPGRTLDRVFTGAVRDDSGRLVGRLEGFAFPSTVRTPTDDRFASELDRLHLLAALIAALVAAVVGVVTASWLARPMSRMATFARGLTRSGEPHPAPNGGPPELRQVGDSLHRLATDLERQRLARLQLAQDLAHELRTPVMLIQGRLEAMQDGIVEPGDASIAALHATTLRLGRLIGEIEVLAEERAEAPPLRRERLDFAEAVAHAVPAVRPALEQRGIHLTQRLATCFVLGDPLALDRIITNLLTNAAKYAPAGSQVHLETCTAAGVARLSVADEGGALAGPEGKRVFERFFRGSNARIAEEEGLGLGLTIARQLAEQMGGSLSLTADERRTRFDLRLPLITPPQPVIAEGSIEGGTSRRAREPDGPRSAAAP